MLLPDTKVQHLIDIIVNQLGAWIGLMEANREANYEQILVSEENAVATITLNRPERMNAWTYQMHDELTRAINSANADPDIGALVITGAGRAFCAGADIGDVFAKQQESGGESARGGVAGDWVALLRRSKPIIAAVNGASIGVGATMILPCDVIMASSAAKIGLGFIKMGVVPELASSHFLVQRMGFGRASEMCLSGRLYPGTEAQEQGLVDRLVEPDQLVAAAQTLAGEIAQNPAPQLLWIKQLLTENGSETDLQQVQAREMALLQQAYDSVEHKEAISAFMEKRAPDFRAAAASSKPKS